MRVLRLELALGGLLAGALLAAAALAAPAAAPPAPPVSGVAPWHPTPPSRFAAALQHLGTSPRRWWSEHGTVNVLLHDASLASLPQIHVASAIAATTAQHTCRCRIRRYRVVTDRYGPDTITIAFGRPLRRGDWRGRVDERTIAMDGASDTAVARRARALRRRARGEEARIVVRVIVRDGFRVFSYARRPATGHEELWAAPGLHL